MTDVAQDGRMGCFGISEDGLGWSGGTGPAGTGVVWTGRNGVPAVQGPAAADDGPLRHGLPGGGAGREEERGGIAGGLRPGGDGGQPGGIQPAPSGGGGHCAGGRHRLGCAGACPSAGAGTGALAPHPEAGNRWGESHAPTAGALAEFPGWGRMLGAGRPGGAGSRIDRTGRGPLATGGRGGRGVGGRRGRGAFLSRGPGSAARQALAERRGAGGRLLAVGLHAGGAGTAVAPRGAVCRRCAGPVAYRRRGAGGGVHGCGTADRRGGRRAPAGRCWPSGCG